MRNHPRYATAESAIAAITSMLNTADKVVCTVSLNPASMPRELIAQTVCVGNPTIPIAIKRPPTPERLLWRQARRTPTPKAINNHGESR
jgi:hypothetical protein